MSDLYAQAVSAAADAAATSYLISLGLPGTASRTLEDHVRDVIAPDPFPARSVNSEDREIAFEWSFSETDVPAITSAAQNLVTIALK